MAEIFKKNALQESSRPANRSVIESEVFDASRKARVIVQEAQDKAETILAQAHAQAREELEAARQQGYQTGEAQGLNQYQAAVVHVNREYDDLLGQAEQQLVGLAVGVARKIIDQELTVNPQAIVDIVRKALAPMNRKRSIVLRVNPEDRRVLDHRRPELLENMLHGGHIVFVNDADITRGGCLIETEHGTVDARLETQLSSINAILTGRHDMIEVPDAEPAVRAHAPVQTIYEASVEEVHEEVIDSHEQITQEEEIVAAPIVEAPIDEQAWETPAEQAVVEEVEEVEEINEIGIEAQSNLLKEVEDLSDSINSEDDIAKLIDSLDEFLESEKE